MYSVSHKDFATLFFLCPSFRRVAKLCVLLFSQIYMVQTADGRIQHEILKVILILRKLIRTTKGEVRPNHANNHGVWKWEQHPSVGEKEREERERERRPLQIIGQVKNKPGRRRGWFFFNLRNFFVRRTPLPLPLPLLLPHLPPSERL